MIDNYNMFINMFVLPSLLNIRLLIVAYFCLFGNLVKKTVIQIRHWLIMVLEIWGIKINAQNWRCIYVWHVPLLLKEKNRNC